MIERERVKTWTIVTIVVSERVVLKKMVLVVIDQVKVKFEK